PRRTASPMATGGVLSYRHTSTPRRAGRCAGGTKALLLKRPGIEGGLNRYLRVVEDEPQPASGGGTQDAPCKTRTWRR
ncbi:hypothetical protein MTO96_046832, partial [Rhipicephalus appendiculatus]